MRGESWNKGRISICSTSMAATPPWSMVYSRRRCPTSSRLPETGRNDLLLGPSLDRVAIRDRPRRFRAKLLLRLERPVWLAEQFARDKHQVRAAAGNNLVGVAGLGD